MTQRVALGADHGGFSLKTELLPWLQSQGYEVLDLGAHTLDPADDYPDFSVAVAQAVASGKAPISYQATSLHLSGSQFWSSPIHSSV